MYLRFPFFFLLLHFKQNCFAAFPAGEDAPLGLRFSEEDTYNFNH